MAKKSFKDNPALIFISPAESAAAPSEVPHKLNPLFVETKSKRVQLLMQPSLHARLKERSAARGQSLNDLAHTILSEWADAQD